jgi:dTDP-4-amino-4,6-dideoxygalactose transaminase
MDKIPFNRPYLVGREFEYMERAMATLHVSGDGHFTKQCHTSLHENLGVSKVLLTTSCTHALELAALLLDLEGGDEVIVPSFTFVSTVNAFALRGVRPVFIDIRPDTLNLNELLLERVITPRTKAIVPVHYAGVGCEMNAIVEIASRHGIAIVEDNAHGLFGKYRGKYLGTLGHLGAQSFHQTKNFHCGEGGALLINDLRYGERAEILREKGTDRNRFFRGEVDKYTWVDIGSSYLPSDLLAAFLYAQLESREFIQTDRRRVWQIYYDQLRDWAGAHGVRLPVVPAYCEQTYHMFYVLLPSEQDRDALINHLKNWSISAVFHYLPLHLSAMGRRFGGRSGDCPVTEDVSARLLRLPFYTCMTEQEQSTVISSLKAFAGWQTLSSRAQVR